MVERSRKIRGSEARRKRAPKVEGQVPVVESVILDLRARADTLRKQSSAFLIWTFIALIAGILSVVYAVNLVVGDINTASELLKTKRKSLVEVRGKIGLLNSRTAEIRTEIASNLSTPGAIWSKELTVPKRAIGVYVGSKAEPIWGGLSNHRVAYRAAGLSSWQTRSMRPKAAVAAPAVIVLPGAPLNLAASDDGKAWVAVGRNGMIVASADGGLTWSLKNSRTSKSLWRVAASGNGKTWIAIGPRGTIVASTDGGLTWSLKNSRTTNSLYALAASGDGNIWVAVGDKGTIVASTDGGGSWSLKNSGTLNRFSRVAVSSDGKTWIAVGQKGTIIASADGARTWSLKNSGTLNNISRVTASTDGRTWVAIGVKGTIVASTDGGLTWSFKNGGTSNNHWRVAASKDGKTWVVAGDRGTIVVSADGGLTWSLKNSRTTNSLSVLAGRGDGKIWVAVGRKGTIVASTDGGLTWSLKNSRTTNSLYALAASGDGKIWVAVGDKGTIIASTDGGGSWSLRKSAARNSLYALTARGDGKTWVAFGNEVFGQGGVLVRSIDGSNSWSTVGRLRSRGLSLRAMTFGDRGKLALSVGSGGEIWRTKNGGATWASVAPSGQTRSLYAVHLDVGGKLAIAVGSRGVILRSTDGGNSWRIPIKFTRFTLYGARIAPDGRTVLAVGGSIFGSRGVVLRSEDLGRSWKVVKIPSQATFQAVAIAPDSKIAVAVGQGGALIRTTDGGKSWIVLTSGTANLLRGVAFAPDGRTAIAVGAKGTILISRDTGKSWDRLDNPPTTVELFAVQIIKRDGFAWALGRNGEFLVSRPSDVNLDTVVGKLKGIDALRKLSKDPNTSGFVTSSQRDAIEKLGIDLKVLLAGRRSLAGDIQGLGASARIDLELSVQLTTLGLRIAIIIVTLIVVQILVSLYRYNRRLAAYYDARAYALTVIGEPDIGIDGLSLPEIMTAFSPDKVDFGKPPKSVIEHAVELARDVVKSDRKLG